MWVTVSESSTVTLGRSLDRRVTARVRAQIWPVWVRSTTSTPPGRPLPMATVATVAGVRVPEWELATQVTTTRGTKFATVGVAIVAGAVAVKPDPEV
jgi:hypothetical protein